MPNDHIHVWQDDAIPHRFGEQDFDPNYWHEHGRGHAIDGGRGGSSRMTIDGQDFILRRYLRGGLVQHVVSDRYLWTGLTATRPAREQQVIEHALHSGLPVPAVAAWLVIRRGFSYQAAIISRFIPHQATLAGMLAQQALATDIWEVLGGLIRRMHDEGIDHADLNANNILIDKAGDFYLIDFDRARLRLAGGRWRQGNLDRLLRSLRKIANQHKLSGRVFHFSDDDWQSLLAAYR
jgi:3-deoxy-D-manno-octulosonic acid kinase